MYQLNIYNEIGLSDDPVFNQLSNLKINDVISLSGLQITKNNLGWFEIFNDEIHECQTDIHKCYDFINSIIFSLKDF